jgi:hypothetical protein
MEVRCPICGAELDTGYRCTGNPNHGVFMPLVESTGGREVTICEMPGEAPPVVIFDGPGRFEVRTGVFTDVDK